MTYASMIGGLDYPTVLYKPYVASSSLPGPSNETAMAATADKIAMIGYAKVVGRLSGKVISAAGGGSIAWRSAVCTWANAGTSMDIGIQGVSTSGPVAQPNGTYGVKRTLTGGDGNVTSSANKTTSMTGGASTSTLSHGDLFAVVWDMTARAGADSVIVNCGAAASTSACIPVTNLFTAAAWRTTGGKTPNVIITADDGTLITMEDTISLATTVNEAFADATNPDERGLIFQVPWDCKVDGIWLMSGFTDANSDCTVTLYSTPLGTPASMGSFALLAEQSSANANDRYRFLPFASEVTLSAATDYVVAVRATGSTNTRLPACTIMDQTHRALNPGGTTVAKVTRDGGSGAFTAEATPITMYAMGVRISAVNISATATAPRTYSA